MKDGAVMPRFSQRTLVREAIQQKWIPVLRENALPSEEHARHRHAIPFTLA
jgi:hypothetical protein